MRNLRVYAAIAFGVVGIASSDGWAADIMPMKAKPAAAAASPAPCTNFADFITTNCQLSWQGIQIYGTIDAGGGWQSHGAPMDTRFTTGASYYIQKMNRTPMWGLAPNAMSQSNIGIKGALPLQDRLLVGLCPRSRL